MEEKWKSALHIDLSGAGVLGKIPQKKCSKITHVTLLVPQSREWDYNAVWKVGKMFPNLACIHIKSKSERASMTVLALVKLLEARKDSLEEIRSYGILWCMPNENKPARHNCSDMDLHECLTRAKKLREVHFHGQGSTPVSLLPMAPILLQAFNDNTTLQDVSIVPGISGGFCNFQRGKEYIYINLNKGHDVKYLIDNIRDLHPVELTLDGTFGFNDGIKLFENSHWQDEPTLKSLELAITVNDQSQISQLNEILRNKTGSIESLHLRLHQSLGFPVSPIAMLKPIAENQSLKKVCLSSDFIANYPFIRRRERYQSRLCDKIQSRLTCLGYRGGGLPVLDQVKDFEALLEKNTSLCEISLRQGTFAAPGIDIPLFCEKAKFWLKLNSCGRKHLLSSPHDAKLWFSTITKHKKDPRITFHLLSLNPSFLDPCHLHLNDSKRRKSKRKRSS